MKSLVSKVALLGVLICTGNLAQAKHLPAWMCSLNFNGVSKGVQLLIGVSEFKGSGNIRCVSLRREEVNYPILVTMRSAPIAPRIGFGVMELYGEALQISLDEGSPESLLGNYLVLEGRAALVGGVGVIAAVRTTNENLSLNISLQLVRGLGIDLGFRKMKLELDPSRMM